MSSEATPHRHISPKKSGRSGKHDTLWIIDPLDGTTIFCTDSRCLPFDRLPGRGRLEHAVVYDRAWGAVTPPAAAGRTPDNRLHAP